jgi:thiamine pyrophosphate-dependent acetolactate synthase large subunit-like protein
LIDIEAHMSTRPANAADILIETLLDWGVDTVFGLPGDGINGIIEALRVRQDRVRFIQARHEQAAAFMACAHAKWTGRLGVCLATTGPGGINLLNGLYDACFDRAPVLAITGLPYHDLAQTSTQQDVDHTRLFQDVAEYSVALQGVRHVRTGVSLACRTALARRGVAHVAIAVDLQEQALDDDQASPRHKVEPSVNLPRFACVPDEAAIANAARVLDAGRRVMILAGQGARGAGDALLATSELLAAPIAKALLGKDVVPDVHPNVMGGVGYLGARPSQQAMAACDTLLIVGSGFPYVEYYPKPGQAKVVQIDADPARISLRYPVDAAVVGDARLSLERLNAVLEARMDRGFLEQARSWKDQWLGALAAGAQRAGQPMKPQRVVHELDARLAEDAIIATDSGHHTGLAAQYLQLRGRQRFAVSGTLASMGCGVPYAIAAALAFPRRQVIAIVGDGGLGMCLAELATCVRYQLPVKVIVINNRSLGQIKWEQMMFLGNPEFATSLAPVDFARVAGAMGMHARRVDAPEDCAMAIEELLAHPGPALLDAVVDANEPMLPPKRREDYMKKLQQALDAGTPDRARIEKAMREEPARTALQE